MKKLLITFLYGLACFIPLMFLVVFFDIDFWFVNIIVSAVSLFIGSFFYAQSYGIQVMDLKHFSTENRNNIFRTRLKISGHGFLDVSGNYMTSPYTKPYADLALQAKLFKALNTVPNKNFIQDLASNKKDEVILWESAGFFSPVRLRRSP